MKPLPRTETSRGIDPDQAAAEQLAAQQREAARPTVIDTDSPGVVEAFRAVQMESARTVLGDRALAEQKRNDVKRDLQPALAVGGQGMASKESGARTVIAAPDERSHSPESIAAFAAAQGVKVTPPGTKKPGFFKNLFNAPRDAWRMLQGEPPKYSEAKREPIPDSTPIATFESPSVPSRTVDANDTTFYKVDPLKRRLEAPSATPEQQEYARLNALRETLVDQGLLDRDGEPTEELRLYPDKYGVGPGDQEKLSQMQRDRFLTESRTMNG